MKTQQAISYILEKLELELPTSLTYHGVKHTEYVIEASKKLFPELSTNKERNLLLVASAFHDSGFLSQYKSNEPDAVKIVKTELPKFDFNESEIEIISKMILATNIKVEPKTHLEKLMCDADFYYLGGSHYHSVASFLRTELSEVAKVIYTDNEWIELQIKFLEKHEYYSNTAKELRESGKQQRIKELKEQLLLS